MGKLSGHEIESIQEMRKEGRNLSEIGNLFGITHQAVRYHTIPEFKQACIARANKHGKHRQYKAESSRRKNHKLRMAVINLLGGKCARCSVDDWRVLQVNHLNGGGGADYHGTFKGNTFFRAILSGKRSREDLNLLCANCNIIYQYERGAIVGK